MGYPMQPKFSAMDTSSTGAFTRPSPAQSWSALDTSSMDSLVQQPAFKTSLYETASTGAYVSSPTLKSWSAFDTTSTGAYTKPSMGYKYQAMESASATNPYTVNMLNQNIAPMTEQAAQTMPTKSIMGGEQHVVENDLQMHVNHEGDKTILTKRVVHHSPVLHKTIRTHQIARDVVHDKQVHHMNVVEDRVKQVPGKQYIGTKQQVDHTTANPPASQIAQPMIAQPLSVETMPMKSLHMYKKF